MSAPPIGLPDRPLVTIVPSRKWGDVNLREVWTYRDLLFFLTWRDIKVRYKQTALGAAWAVLQPLLAMLVFTVFFGRLARIPSDGIAYPLFAYIGLTPWTFFSNGVLNSSTSLISNTNLVSKIYFPRVLIPSSAVLAGLVDLGIAFGMAGVLLAWYRIAVSWSVLLVPVLAALTTLLALAVGMWSAAVNVKYRDVKYALPFLMQIWMYATPIVYPSSLVPAKWRWLLALNPMAGFIEAYRAAVFGRPLDWNALGLSVAVTLVFFLYAAHVFRRMETLFADYV